MSVSYYTVLPTSGGWVNGFQVPVGSLIALNAAEARYELDLGHVIDSDAPPPGPSVPALLPTDTVPTLRGLLPRSVPMAAIESYLLRETGSVDAYLDERAAVLGADLTAMITARLAEVLGGVDADHDTFAKVVSALAALAQTVSGVRGSLLGDADAAHDTLGKLAALIAALDLRVDTKAAKADLLSVVEATIAALAGYAPLGPDGRVPAANLPIDGSYRGTYDAAANIPTITSGGGTKGDYFIVSVPGTVAADSIGPVVAGDQIRRGLTAWQHIPASLDKASVGLGNVDNVADLLKPVSGPQAAEFAKKLDAVTRLYAGEAEVAFADLARARINVRAFLGVDPTGVLDSTAGLRQAAAKLTTGSVLWFPRGTYKVTGKITLPAGVERIAILGDRAIIDASGFDPESVDGIFMASGTEGQPVQVTFSVVAGANRIVVTDPATFARGQWAQLCSTRLHVGISGQSGYNPNTIGEYVKIRGIDGNTIVTDEPIIDDYSLNGDTVTLTPTMLLKDIYVSGLEFIGSANGELYPQNPGVPPGVAALDLRLCEDPTIHDCTFRDHPRWAVYLSRCVKPRIALSRFQGRNLETDSNDGLTQSFRFTGAYVASCHGAMMLGNFGEALRRLFDGGSNSNLGRGPIGRNALIQANIALNCYGGLGSHAGDRYQFDANLIIAATHGAIGLRAPNCRVTNNMFVRMGGGCTRVGAASGFDYPETARNGYVEFSRNWADGADSMLEVTGDFTRLLCYDNLGWNLRGTPIRIESKKFKSVHVRGGDYDMSARGTTKAVGFYQKWVAGKGIAPGDIILETTFRNAWRGVSVGGGDLNTPLRLLKVACVFDNTEDVHIRRGASFEDDGSGYFGEIIDFTGSTFLNIPAGGIETAQINRSAREPVRDWSTPDYRRKVVRIVTADPTVSPPLGTFEPGDLVDLQTPEAGKPSRWICTLAGSASISARSGSIAAGSRTLTLTSALTMPLGTWLLVPGAGSAGGALRAEIVAVSADSLVVTLDRAAGTTVSGASVTNAAAVWRVHAIAGLGAAAALDVGTGPGSVAAGDDSRIVSGVRVLAASAVKASLTGTTAETVLATIIIPGGAMGPNGQIRPTTLWATTANTNSKSMRVRLGGLSGPQLFIRTLLTNTAASDRWQLQIANRGSEVAQITNHSTGGGWASASNGAASVLSAIDTTVDQQLVITGQLANPSDQLDLDSFIVELLRPPA